MKILMFHATHFEITAAVASSSALPEVANRAVAIDDDAVVVFVHVEHDDPARGAKLTTRCAKNIKWLANKREIRRVVLHSFDHLSQSKAAPHEANEFIEGLAERLLGNGYNVTTTPFGYSCAWDLRVHRDPMAKVFKDL